MFQFNREEFRKMGQLWYEIFQFSMNISPEECFWKTKHELIHKKVILAMHPHGIVPFHAVLWAACGDQHFVHPETGEKLYGFGAAADVVQYVPFLRNILGFLTAGSASYPVLKRGLVEVRTHFCSSHSDQQIILLLYRVKQIVLTQRNVR
jgi:hypothetical protein